LFSLPAVGNTQLKHCKVDKKSYTAHHYHSTRATALTPARHNQAKADI